MLIDSHVNLHAPQFDEDRDAVIARAREAGVRLMVEISDKLATFEATHANVDRALDWIAAAQVERAVLTNLHLDLDYSALSALLPANVEVACDGWSLRLP